MRPFSNDERRRRLGRRHHLASYAESVEQVAGDLIGFHSSDPGTVYLSARARVDGFAIEDLESALYEDQTLIRILGMRRTMFVVPKDLVPVVHHSSTVDFVAGQRRRLADLLESTGLADDGLLWIDDVSHKTYRALAGRRQATAAELTEDVPELGEKFTLHKKDGSVMGTFGVSTRILFFLATEGKIVRCRPKGSWLSSQYRWAPFEVWLGGPMEDLDPDQARIRLIERWLETFGPATETDMKWWTGWTLGKLRKALDELTLKGVELDVGRGVVLADDIEPMEEPEPWAAFLPSLDPTIMGWKERDWYLGEHAKLLFDRNGNAGPTVMVDGRVVGGWAQRKTGEIVYRILDDVGTEAKSLIEVEAAALQSWLGDTVVTPRFRTPLEKELV